MNEPKDILKQVITLIGSDNEKTIELLNSFINDDAIEVTKKLCPHSILIEHKNTDSYDWCSDCMETITI